MGFSIAVASAIFFSTFLFFSIIIYGEINNTNTSIDDAKDEKYDREREREDTNLEIINVLYNKTNSLLTVNIKNDGSSVLNPNEIDFLLDGVVNTDDIQTRVNSLDTSVWAPEETLTITLTTTDISYQSSVNPRLNEIFTTQLTSVIDVFSSDRIYLIDNNNHIDIYDLDKTYNTSITDAQLTNPQSVSINSSRIFIQDDNDHIDVFKQDGTYTVTYNPAELSNNLNGIETNLTKIFVADGTNGIVLLDFDGNYDSTINTNLVSSKDLAVKDKIYVVDNDAHIDVFSLTGSHDSTTTTNFANGGELTAPKRISITSNFVYVLDNNDHIDIFDLDGTFSSTVSTSLSNPAGIDVAGKIYIADQNNGLVVLNTGTVIKIVTEYGVALYETI